MDAPITAERRQISVLFCDLVGSTELTARLDPEDVRAFLVTYLNCCSDCIQQVGGFVARFTGDGVLAYFGYPQVREDDAERALQAAMLIRDAVAGLSVDPQYTPAVRVGIATGVTVVGDLIGAGAAAERLVVGSAPNLAARLQASARPNQIIASEQTRRLAAGVFAFRGMGKRRLKGFSEPQPLWEVAGVKPTTSRFGARPARTLSPLIGRDLELAQLARRWEACLAGRGGLVALVGEPGIGKSRLVHELHRLAMRKPHVWLEGGGAEIFRNTPLHGVAQMIRGRAARGAAAGRRRRRSGSETDEPPYLGGWPDLVERFQTPAGDLGRATESTSRELVAEVVDWVEATAAQTPTVVVVEDLHWVDPSTLDFLTELLATPRPVLVICTSREAPPAHWSFDGSSMLLKLDRLDLASTRQIITAAANALPETTLQQLAARSGGVPLFAEELARLAMDGVFDPQGIPSSLSDLLLSGLDRTGPARPLVQIASVLGGEFRADLLGAIAQADMPTWPQALSDLVSAEVLAQLHEGVYGFRHALIQDAAYGGLLRAQQADLHRRAASAIAAQFPEIAELNPEIMAQHWEGAGDDGQALAAWEKAAGVTAARQAWPEAQHAYEQALAILARSPACAASPDQELLLQTALARVLQITRGYSAPETVAATVRARRLADTDGGLDKRFPNLLSAWVSASSAADYARSATLADQLSLMAQASAREAWLASAHMALVTTRHRVGDLQGSEDAFLVGRAYFENPDFVGLTGAFVQTWGNAAIIAWLLGDDGEARRRLQRVTTFIEAGATPLDVTFGAFMTATQMALLGEYAAAERHARRAMELADEAFPHFSGNSRAVLGYALARQDRASDGLPLLIEGMARMRAGGAGAALTMYETWRAEICLDADDDASAAAALAAALTCNPLERFYRPQTLRIQAELHAHRGRSSASRRAIAQSRAQAQAMNANVFLR